MQRNPHLESVLLTRLPFENDDKIVTITVLLVW